MEHSKIIDKATKEIMKHTDLYAIQFAQWFAKRVFIYGLLVQWHRERGHLDLANRLGNQVIIEMNYLHEQLY
jgi:hypothetical protein